MLMFLILLVDMDRCDSISLFNDIFHMLFKIL